MPRERCPLDFFILEVSRRIMPKPTCRMAFLWGPNRMFKTTLGRIAIAVALTGCVFSSSNRAARASTYLITGTGNLSIFSATITTSDIPDPSFPGGYDVTGITTGSVSGFGPIVRPYSSGSRDCGNRRWNEHRSHITYSFHLAPFFDSAGLGFVFDPSVQTPQLIGGGIWYDGGDQFSLFIGNWALWDHGGLGTSPP